MQPGPVQWEECARDGFLTDWAHVLVGIRTWPTWPTLAKNLFWGSVPLSASSFLVSARPSGTVRCHLLPVLIEARDQEEGALI